MGRVESGQGCYRLRQSPKLLQRGGGDANKQDQICVSDRVGSQENRTLGSCSPTTLLSNKPENEPYPSAHAGYLPC